ncbi:hypothetical protein OAO87_03825, partial [bacterium]|nr:hypothetical protein [bacterium]
MWACLSRCLRSVRLLLPQVPALLPAARRAGDVAATRDTTVSPVLSLAQTPQLYVKFIPMLFVGFAHNLLLESYVSRLTQVRPRAPPTHARPRVPPARPRPLPCAQLVVWGRRGPNPLGP